MTLSPKSVVTESVSAMNATDDKITLKSDTKSDEIKTDDPEYEPRFLSEAGLFLYIKPQEKPFPPVPPSTPRELISDCYVTNLPKMPDNVDDIEIPYVRECGIRDSLGILAKYFHCEDYRNNLVQFWFLDVLVDCIWRAQDEFKFPLQEQKVLLEWILFVLQLITTNNVTKPLMFEILNEALKIAEEYVQSGGPNSPTPNKLFTLNLEKQTDDEDNIRTNIISTGNSNLSAASPIPELNPSKQNIIILLEDDVQVFSVPNTDNVIDVCLSSSVDPLSEYEQVCEAADDAKSDMGKSESSVEFYKPNMATPPRFKSLHDFEADEDSGSTEENAEEEGSKTVREWLNIPRKETAPPCPSEEVTKKMDFAKITSETTTTPSYLKVKHQQSQVVQHDTFSKKSIKTEPQEEVLDKEHIFKIYYDYNMWLLKNEYMADPNIGWSPSLESYKNVLKSNKLKNDVDSKKGLEILGTENRAEIADKEKNVFIKLCVLMAAKQIVFEYFNYSFSFELARISLKYPQYLITQDINTTWNIPKDIRGDLKKPIPKKPKKEKPKKEKKAKEKKDKSSKKSKSSKESKGKGKEKKGKDKKAKSEKKSKSSKKSEKDKKFSKEEKKELERLRKEQEEIERKRLKEAENKMFMFPLKDAVDDEFFTKIFPDFKAKKKGGKKGDKSSKSSQSDKSSKKGKKGKK